MAIREADPFYRNQQNQNQAPPPTHVAPPVTNVSPVQSSGIEGLSPEQLLLMLGQNGYGPSYNSNDAGSFQRNYNQLLSGYSPDQLIQRYSNPNQTQGQFNATPLDTQQFQAYQSFKSIIGRDPSAEEFAQVIPQYSNGKQFGDAWVANLKTQLMQNPNDPLNQGRASQFSPQIQQTFKSMLGREATPDELSHFGGLFGTGNIDAYQLQDFLRGTPEYQKGQDTQFRQGLNTELENNDVSFFNRAKQGVISQFMNNGTGTSSALDSALTDLMGQIAEKRSGFLAGLSSDQYQGNKNLAIGNYQGAQNQYLANQDYNRQQSLNNQNYLTSRGNELTDYQRQMSDYMNYANSQKPSNLFNYLNTGANLANAGANLWMAGK